jgi:hypothetical protein
MLYKNFREAREELRGGHDDERGGGSMTKTTLCNRFSENLYDLLARFEY